MTRVATVATRGIDGAILHVKASIDGRAGPTVAGVSEREAAEMRRRLEGALESIGEAGAARRMRIEVEPADEHGRGVYDLAALLAALAETGRIGDLGDTLVRAAIDERGTVRETRGTVCAAAVAARERHTLVLASGDLREAGLVQGTRAVPVSTVREALDWADGERDTVIARPGAKAPDTLTLDAAERGAPPPARNRDSESRGARRRRRGGRRRPDADPRRHDATPARCCCLHPCR